MPAIALYMNSNYIYAKHNRTVSILALSKHGLKIEGCSNSISRNASSWICVSKK